MRGRDEFKHGENDTAVTMECGVIGQVQPSSIITQQWYPKKPFQWRPLSITSRQWCYARPLQAQSTLAHCIREQQDTPPPPRVIWLSKALSSWAPFWSLSNSTRSTHKLYHKTLQTYHLDNRVFPCRFCRRKKRIYRGVWATHVRLGTHSTWNRACHFPFFLL